MRKLIIMIFLCCCISFCSQAEEMLFTEGEFTYRMEDGGAVLVEWVNWADDNTREKLEVPAELGGIALKGIGTGAFMCDPCEEGFEISIPEGVTYLAENAFEGCNGAAVICLPSTLETIPEGCFFGVGAEIVFPNGNPYFTSVDGFLVDARTGTLLYAAPSSQAQPLPTVNRLGDHCLAHWLACKTEVCLPETVTEIGSGVFYDQPDLERVVLPTALSNLDTNSFMATSIQKINIPAGLVEIPSYCFVDCLFICISIPTGIEWIGEYAFYYNWELVKVTLSESVQFVGYNAFPEECDIHALNPATHFETLEEYQVRDPQGEWWE